MSPLFVIVIYISIYLFIHLEQLQGWSFNTSRNLHSYISSNDNITILSPDELCASSPYLVIIICSAIGNHNSRNAIRNTWGNDEYLNKFNLTVKIAFLLGQNDNDTLNVSKHTNKIR